MKRIDWRYHLPSLSFAGLSLGALIAATAIFLYVGFYNIAADAPHSRPVYALLESLRDRSIAVRTGSIAVPGDLGSPTRIATGAGLYGEMCQSCHLAPGVAPTEIAQGLYPAAPQLAKDNDLSPAEQFWVIKHGVKLTAMPAWGKTHPDDLIWDMVAFLRKMPAMTPQQYAAAVASAPKDHDEMMKDMGESK